MNLSSFFFSFLSSRMPHLPGGRSLSSRNCDVQATGSLSPSPVEGQSLLRAEDLSFPSSDDTHRPGSARNHQPESVRAPWIRRVLEWSSTGCSSPAERPDPVVTADVPVSRFGRSSAQWWYVSEDVIGLGFINPRGSEDTKRAMVRGLWLPAPAKGSATCGGKELFVVRHGTIKEKYSTLFWKIAQRPSFRNIWRSDHLCSWNAEGLRVVNDGMDRAAAPAQAFNSIITDKNISSRDSRPTLKGDRYTLEGDFKEAQLPGPIIKFHNRSWLLLVIFCLFLDVICTILHYNISVSLLQYSMIVYLFRKCPFKFLLMLSQDIYRTLPICVWSSVEFWKWWT